MAAASQDIPLWAPYELTRDDAWDRRRVVHLHRRAGFAAPRNVIERDLADGPQKAIDRLLSGATRIAPPPADFDVLSRTIGDAAQASGSLDRLRAWWFYRMLLAPDPLGERLTLLWHNHFATSNRKVQDLTYMREQNELFRRHARAPFGELLRAVVKHPAMLVWLDADSNRAGRPNENLSRELLELFSLGVGNYEESDVQAAARALSGWTVASKKLRFAAQRHDDGNVQLLGREGPMNGDDVLDALLEHKATARRLAWRLGTMFFGDGALGSDALDELAAELRERNLNVEWAVETILRSRLFFAEANLRSRVLGPIEFIVGALHALELIDPPPSTLLLAEWASRMGQELFSPPNVGGWREGRTWLRSRSVIARANFAAALVDGSLWNPPAAPAWETHLPNLASGADATAAVRSLNVLFYGNELPSILDDVIEIARQTPASQQLSAAVAAMLSHPESQMG
jgi:uncharacterized protein (DUF1800 family)